MSGNLDDPADGYFGESVASTYDKGKGRHYHPDEIQRCVAFLADLAPDSALELAIGTGRIAVPLTALGVRVDGIELSRAMASRIPLKPGGESIDVTIGDMTLTQTNREYSLVYLLFNTINNLTSQEAQIECFQNAAAHLAPGGRFVIEVGLPALRKLPPGQDTVPFYIESESDGNGRVGFDLYDVVTQQFSSNHVSVENSTGLFSSIPFRYVWPAELDLMARIAGLEFQSRWGDWTKAPFTAESSSHVSVWTKPL